MSDGPRLTIRFVSEEAFISELEKEFQRNAEVATVVAHRPVTDPTTLGFDISQVADLVAKVVPALGTLIPIVVQAVNRTKPRRILIETPFGKVTFEPYPNMTDAQLKDRLSKLIEVLT